MNKYQKADEALIALKNDVTAENAKAFLDEIITLDANDDALEASARAGVALKIPEVSLILIRQIEWIKFSNKFKHFIHNDLNDEVIETRIAELREQFQV